MSCLQACGPKCNSDPGQDEQTKVGTVQWKSVGEAKAMRCDAMSTYGSPSAQDAIPGHRTRMRQPAGAGAMFRSAAWVWLDINVPLKMAIARGKFRAMSSRAAAFFFFGRLVPWRKLRLIPSIHFRAQWETKRHGDWVSLCFFFPLLTFFFLLSFPVLLVSLFFSSSFFFFLFLFSAFFFLGRESASAGWLACFHVCNDRSSLC